MFPAFFRFVRMVAWKMAHAMQRFCSFRTIKASSIHWTSVMPDKIALMCAGHRASLMEKTCWDGSNLYKLLSIILVILNIHLPAIAHMNPYDMDENPGDVSPGPGSSPRKVAQKMMMNNPGWWIIHLIVAKKMVKKDEEYTLWLWLT